MEKLESFGLPETFPPDMMQLAAAQLVRDCANGISAAALSVMPPMGLGRVRLLCIEDVDLQPCGGGTHVRSTTEIGALRVAKLEKKSARTRRPVPELA
jgi:Ser-tRNA(Ala) deacylase AlaX